MSDAGTYWGTRKCARHLRGQGKARCPGKGSIKAGMLNQEQRTDNHKDTMIWVKSFIFGLAVKALSWERAFLEKGKCYIPTLSCWDFILCHLPLSNQPPRAGPGFMQFPLFVALLFLHLTIGHSNTSLSQKAAVQINTPKMQCWIISALKAI